MNVLSLHNSQWGVHLSLTEIDNALKLNKCWFDSGIIIEQNWKIKKQIDTYLVKESGNSFDKLIKGVYSYNYGEIVGKLTEKYHCLKFSVCEVFVTSLDPSGKFLKRQPYGHWFC